MTPLRLAVIGVGHLGKEHARIASTLPGVAVVGVVDVFPQQAQAVGEKLGVPYHTDFHHFLDKVDAASIVVPTSQHYEVASEFLKRGVPVLVEKPLAPTLRQADKLVELSDKHQAILQVGHIERFNPAFEEVKNLAIQPRFIRAERMGPFSGRSTDIGVVLDLMIHDIDLLLDLVKAPVERVEALGISVFGKNEDIANARLFFTNGCVADVTASRSSPTPCRQMHVWSPEGYASIDFGQRRVTLIQPSQQLREEGLDTSKMQAADRARLKEDLFTRYLPSTTIERPAQDQLTAELKHFVDCVKKNRKPIVSGKEGRDAIAVAEKVIYSLRRHSWNGFMSGPVGPNHLPAPMGDLFVPNVRREAA